MKAIVYHAYGAPEVLRLEEVPRPAPGDNEVLIRIRAAAVNPIDWHFMRGKPAFMRLGTGLRKPKFTRLGMDVAGVVEAAGARVRQLKAGDEVFGVCRGAFAEYACAAETVVSRMPTEMSVEQAASLPVASFTALQALRDRGHLQTGMKVLINGAAGGVGTLAVQIAKWLGAEVTGVCSTRNAEMVKSLGADYAIDYTREDFTRGGERYDIVFDGVGNHSFSECRPVMAPKGVYLLIGGGTPERNYIRPMGLLGAMLVSSFTSQTFRFFMAKPSSKDLEIVGELVTSGKLKTVIDRSYGLSEVPKAIRYLEEGHARGKVVIEIAEGARA